MNNKKKIKNKIGIYPKGQYHTKLINAFKNNKYYTPPFPFKIKHLDDNNYFNHSIYNVGTILSVRHSKNKVINNFNFKRYFNNNINDTSSNKGILPYITKENNLQRYYRNINNGSTNSFIPEYQSFINNSDTKMRLSTNHFISKIPPIEISKRNGFSLTKNNFGNNYLTSDKESFSPLHFKTKTDLSNNNTINFQHCYNTPKHETANISLLNLNTEAQLIKNSFALSIPGKSRNGVSKQNQDNYISLTKLPYSLNVFGVFDGHGDHGHLVSNYLRSFFTDYFHTFKNILSNLTSIPSITEYITSIISKSEKRLATNPVINCSYSGSTCILVFILENYIICSNIGDSRAILITNSNKIISLSRDHKPELPDESERICSLGGIVQRSVPCGPFRVWVKNENYPGLAMSRSIGDFVAESVGVVCTPEVNVFIREEVKAKVLVIASDGVWEYVSNEKVKNIVWDYYNRNDAKGCAEAIKESAVRMWNSTGDGMDDITVVVVFM